MTSTESHSVLITDDDVGFRSTLGEALEREGYHTVLAADGQEAINIVQAEEIHVVLLDMHMPRLTGLETLRRLRHVAKSLPCILISAGADDAVREEARRESAFSVLSKPIDCRTVSRIVRSALDWRMGQRFSGSAG